MAKYVDLKTPEEVIPQLKEMLSIAKSTGKIKKGVNETTKAIERKTAHFVVIAEDVTPEEVVVHIPMLCKENGIPYAFMPTRKELGEALGIPVPTSSAAIESAGDAAEKMQDILKKIPKSK